MRAPHPALAGPPAHRTVHSLGMTRTENNTQNQLFPLLLTQPATPSTLGPCRLSRPVIRDEPRR